MKYFLNKYYRNIIKYLVSNICEIISFFKNGTYAKLLNEILENEFIRKIYTGNWKSNFLKLLRIHIIKLFVILEVISFCFAKVISCIYSVKFNTIDTFK